LERREGDGVRSKSDGKGISLGLYFCRPDATECTFRFRIGSRTVKSEDLKAIRLSSAAR
jgi:hypothetical protein